MHIIKKKKIEKTSWLIIIVLLKYKHTSKKENKKRKKEKIIKKVLTFAILFGIVWEVFWKEGFYKELMFFENWAKRRFLSSRLNITQKNIFFWRVWSWLRMNAGGMPKTCKSNEVAHWRMRACTNLDLDSHLVADGWVTRGWPTFKLGITVRNDC